MSSFISKSACRGRRPSQLVGFNGRMRPHLVARLLKERQVARFIVAPNGYGKTSVGVEYCETVFSWVHVLWLNCQSPCFVRDLDTSDLARMCMQADDGVRLVLFDDVPSLDASRASLFSDAVDELLEHDCEVVVTCSVICDVFASFQKDRVVLSGEDLLLDDEELDASRGVDDRAATLSPDLPSACRVAALAWGDGESDAVDFLRSSFERDLPGHLLLALASMYILKHGFIEDLRAFSSEGPLLDEAWLQAYPHLGFDEENGRFHAPSLAIDDIGQALKKHFDRLVRSSSHETRADLACAWADALLERQNEGARSCDVMRAISPQTCRPAWIARHARDLLKQGCFHAAYRLVCASRTGLAKARADVKSQIGALESVCLYELGDVTGALKTAKRFAFGSDAPDDAMLCCLVLVARHATGKVRMQAIARMRDAVDGLEAGGKDRSFWEWMACAQCACAEGPDALGRAWNLQQEHCAGLDVLNLCASWLFDAVDWGARSERPNAASRLSFDFGPVERFVRKGLEAADEELGNFFLASAGLAMEQAHEAGREYREGPLPTGVLLALRRSEMDLLSQRRSFEQDVRAQRVIRSNWVNTHPGTAEAGKRPAIVPAVEYHVPILTLKLFGRFEASIGGEPINQRLFKRQNTCTLVALLAINQGREMMRETLAQALWPQSSSDLSRKNFYTVWSQLRKALTLKDGTCPYLVRHQYGCSLETRYVQCDTMRLDEICQELLFGQPDLREWPLLYSEINRDFSGDLMPGDQTNALIEAARMDYRVKLIDALLSASQNIVLADNPLWGIWFARMALGRDRTREDAYVALMRAQIAADQRTAAMMTFLKCQRVLADELGIDPSPEAMALYRSLLDQM